MSKYTKGPWIVNVWTTGRRTIEPYPTRMGSVHPIAEIHLQHNEEHQANARLIAAAPELLQACKNLENDNNVIPKHAWDMIQQAIAKAGQA